MAEKPRIAPEPPSVRNMVGDPAQREGRPNINGGAEGPGDGPAAVRVLFTADRGTGSTLGLDAATASALGVAAGQTVRLRAGRREVALTVRVDAAPRPGRAALPPAVLAALGIPPGTPLRMKAETGGRLEAGPFIGVLAPPRRPSNPYAAQTTFFRRLLRHGRDNHLGVFIFSPGEVDWGRRRIRGWVWEDGRGWVQRAFPFPDAVYDRAHPTRASRAALRRFHRMGVPFFNGPVGSKWWQHQVLTVDPVVREALPETRLLTSTRDVAALLRRHGSVYVKAINGGKGIDVWQITALSDGGFAVRRTDRRGRSRGVRVRSVASVVRAVLGRRRPYIVQARLWLMRWQGRIFDIRVLVQKDGTGTWRVTGMGLRVGPRGSIVSNLYGGGRAAPLEPVLQELLQRRSPEEVAAECRQLALRIADLIDRASVRVAELGIDLALDTSERLWFLEANSATGRTVFRRLGPPEVARAADVRPLEYAAGLAGFA